MVRIFWTRLGAVLTRERILLRLATSWCSFVTLLLFLYDGNFGDIAFAQDIRLYMFLAVIPLFFLVYTILAALIGTHLQADSWFLFVTGTVCVWNWLVSYGDSENRFLFTLAVAVAYTLFLFYIVHMNLPLLQQFQLNEFGLWGGVICLALVAGTAIALITCLRYKTFSAPNFDFGLFCNMFYNMEETGLPLSTCERDRLLSHFAVHISPVYYLFLPFFYLFPSPLTLQIGQAVVLALGVIPVVLLARHFKLSKPVTLLLSALYLFYPALSTGCFYDLHENCFLPLFLLLTFLFYEKKKYLPMYLSAILVLSVKEDAAVYLAIFAIYLLLAEKKYLHGTILAAMAVGYFLLCGFLLSRFGEGMMVNRFDNLIYDGDMGLLGAIKTAIVNPGYLLTQLFSTEGNTWEKITYLLQMLLPLGLLPFCAKKASGWLLTLPLLINLLTMYIYQYNINFQYHFAILAFLVYAALKNLSDLTAPTQRTMLTIAASCCLCLYLSMVAPKVGYYVGIWANHQDTFEQMEEILDTVPEDASVAASTFLVAHLADREEIYEIRYHEKKTDVDYAVFDMRYPSDEDLFEYYRENGYEIISGDQSLILVLKKNG